VSVVSLSSSSSFHALQFLSLVNEEEKERTQQGMVYLLFSLLFSLFNLITNEGKRNA